MRGGVVAILLALGAIEVGAAPDVSFGALPFLEGFTLAAHVETLSAPEWYRDNFSGCCLLPSTGELLVVLNRRQDSLNPAILVYRTDGVYQRRIEMTGFDDTEGICVVDGASGQVAIVEEGLGAITIVTITSGTTSLDKGDGRTLSMGLVGLGNSGIEGITYQAGSNTFYAVREKTPLAVYRVVDLGGTNSATTVAFDAAAQLGALCTDLSDVQYDAGTGHLLILSDESRLIMECDVEGNVIGELPVDFDQPEGLTLSSDRQTLYVLGEPREFSRYGRVAVPIPTGSGNEGTTALVPVWLSSPDANMVTVEYTIGGGSATSGSDYAPASGSVSFSPGATSATINVSLLTDSVLEAPETATITLVNPIHAGLGAASAYQQTIVDRGLFDWAAIASPQASGVAFRVSIRAVDVGGGTLSGFTGTVGLQSTAGWISPATSGNFVGGIWEGAVTVHGLGAGVTLVAGDATGHTGSSAPFDVEAMPTLRMTLPERVEETQLQATGLVSVTAARETDVTVALTGSDGGVVEVPVSVTLLAGQMEVAVPLGIVDDALLNGGRAVTVWASAVNYESGSDTLVVADDEQALLTVTLPVGASEGDGVLVGGGAVEVSAPPDRGITVWLQSLTLGEVAVPASILIPAGTTTGAFDVTIVDDTWIDGTQSATVTAEVVGWPVAAGTLAVGDNEQTNLLLQVAGRLREGAGVVTNGGWVALTGRLPTDVQVHLGSLDETELVVPASVTIVAGATSTTFNLSLPDDALFDTAQVVELQASALGFTGTSRWCVVMDDEPVTNYVAPSGLHVWPFTRWEEAATNIQDAIDAVSAGSVVLVGDGIFDSGGAVAGPGGTGSRVVVGTGVTVRSVNGPEGAWIVGAGTSTTVRTRCATVLSGGRLEGFTLTNGVTWGVAGSEGQGGGVWCADTSAVVARCRIVGNAAWWGGGAYRGLLSECVLSGNVGTNGGGANRSLLKNCLVVGNLAGSGGGVNGGVLVNCTVSSNVASYGGGVVSVTQHNSIVYFNVAASSPNHVTSVATFTCTMPAATAGSSNINRNPLFVDAGAGNYRLQLGSPCTNAGNTVLASTGADVAGEARVAHGRVDMGAYEYDGWRDDTDGDWMADAWELTYGLNATSREDGALHADVDGIANADEFIADTDPTDPDSYFRIAAITNALPVVIAVSSSVSRAYGLEYRDAMLGTGWEGMDGQSDVPGNGGLLLLMDDRNGATQGNYRVWVGLP